jgi:hypothetical protein
MSYCYFWRLLKCSLYLLQKCLTLWPTYAFLQSVHVTLYIQLAKYLLEIWVLGFKYFSDVCSFFAYQTKGTHLNTIERFYIHKEALPVSQLNDKHTIFFPNDLWYHHKNWTITPSTPTRARAHTHTHPHLPRFSLEIALKSQNK